MDTQLYPYWDSGRLVLMPRAANLTRRGRPRPCRSWGLFESKVFKYQSFLILRYFNVMIYYCIFYINTCLKIKYFKLWYLVDMYKKLVSAIKTLDWSEVLNTLKISWYLTNHGIQNRIFYMFIKHLWKNIMISFNTFYIKTLKTIYSRTPPEPVEVPLLQLSR
jgi:hypothetical protein